MAGHIMKVLFFGPQKLTTGKEFINMFAGDEVGIPEVKKYLIKEFPKISLGEIILVNGKSVSEGTKLKPGDELMFLPSIGGG